jgi:hypothetical protein
MSQRLVKLLTPQGKQWWTVEEVRLRDTPNYWSHGDCDWANQIVLINKRQILLETIGSAIHEATHVAEGYGHGEALAERVAHNALVLIAPYIAELLED